MSETDVYRRQILTPKDSPRARRVNYSGIYILEQTFPAFSLFFRSLSSRSSSAYDGKRNVWYLMYIIYVCELLIILLFQIIILSIKYMTSMKQISVITT